MTGSISSSINVNGENDELLWLSVYQIRFYDIKIIYIDIIDCSFDGIRFNIRKGTF